MTSRTLFSIVLKVLGIFFLKDILVSLAQLIPVFYMFSNGNTFEDGIWTLVLSLAILAVYVLNVYILVFKTDWLIDKLKLDKGLQEDPIPLNIHRSTILSISIIVIGGLIVADEIPNLCRQVYIYFQLKRMSFEQEDPDTSNIIYVGVKLLIGLLLIGNQRQIVKLIEYKRPKWREEQIKNDPEDGSLL